MSPISRLSLSIALFFALALILIPYTTVGSIAFASLGTLQILNVIAHRLPFSRAIYWAHAMAFETLAFIGIAAMRFSRLPYTEMKQGQPLLLIHGYLHFGSVWSFHKKRLEALGFGPIYTLNLGHPFRSIRTYAEKVKVKAEAIARETGRKDLILIGHSMGGLVALEYATRLAPPSTVTDVITIASPLAGTPLAYIALGPNGREMYPKSAFLKELQAAIGQTSVRLYHIATKSDQLVIPGISAVLPQNQHFILEDIGHTSLLYSHRVSSKIAEWLKKMSTK